MLHCGKGNFNKLKVGDARREAVSVTDAKAQSVCPLCLWYTVVQSSCWPQKSDLLLIDPQMEAAPQSGASAQTVSRNHLNIETGLQGALLYRLSYRLAEQVG